MAGYSLLGSPTLSLISAGSLAFSAVTGGAQRTPVRQKMKTMMKTMSRSLQMLNVARLNAKAQKCQAEEALESEKGPEMQRKRRSGDRAKAHSSAHSRSSSSLLEMVTERSSLSQGLHEAIGVSLVT